MGDLDLSNQGTDWGRLRKSLEWPDINWRIIDPESPERCATGTMTNLYINVDGDIHIDLILDIASDPSLITLINDHNSDNTLVCEIPLGDRSIFDNLDQLANGQHASICGVWRLEIEKGWNEFHPVTSLAITGPVMDIPDLRGLSLADAQDAVRLAGLGLIVARTVVGGADISVPTVLSQEPPPHAQVVPGTAMSVVVADPPSMGADVPDVRGLSLADAQDAVMQAGIGLTIASVVVGGAGIDEPTVLSQEPPPRTRIAAGTAISVVVAEPQGGIRR